MTSSSSANISVDVVIIGGGIAGLWLLNRLCNQGYNAILFEQSALGSGQTVASQGMIHGGIKYTLGGALSGASEAIAGMPEHWRQCLRGKGDVDLSGARILSDHFYLWSTATTASRMTTLFASKLTRGRVDNVARENLPDVFQHQSFSGTVYRLVDMVVDTPSVVAALAKNYQERIFLLPPDKAQWSSESGGKVSLAIRSENKSYLINASAFIFAAGEGNETLLKQVGARQPKMQRRPLQQVMVKHRYPHQLFGHCLGAETRPRLTISSHSTRDGAQVWYLGGSLAENGIKQTEAELISTAREELKKLMPWVNLTDAQWASLPIERAEPKQRNFARPDKAFAAWARPCSNVIAAWPTKLTLCPNLGSELGKLLDDNNIVPSHQPAPSLELPSPPLAPGPWDVAFA